MHLARSGNSSSKEGGLARCFQQSQAPLFSILTGCGAASRLVASVAFALALSLSPLAPAAIADSPAPAETAEAQVEVLKPKLSPVRRSDLPAPFRQEIPASIQDLLEMERHVQAMVGRVSPAVVAVRVGSATGSGVVISADGYVLTAAHVSEEPNRTVRFTFPDGTTARGRTLGNNHGIDAGLMKITDEGEWPHVEMGQMDQTRLGDWVVALGHPGGFDPDRSIVARLGRVIRLASGVVQTDCTLLGGDSGGALFDMHGRVVGVHSRISESTSQNYHVPVLTYLETWERLAQGENWGGEIPRSQSFVGIRGLDRAQGFELEIVLEGSPADRAGMLPGDVVLRVNGQPMRDYSAFLEFMGKVRPGDELTFNLRRDEEDMTVQVTAARRPRG
jgi:serine protease Do